MEYAQWLARLTVYLDVESVYFLLMEMVKKLGNCDECKDICLQICDILFAASFPTTLKARLCFAVRIAYS